MLRRFISVFLVLAALALTGCGSFIKFEASWTPPAGSRVTVESYVPEYPRIAHRAMPAGSRVVGAQCRGGDGSTGAGLRNLSSGGGLSCTVTFVDNFGQMCSVHASERGSGYGQVISNDRDFGKPSCRTPTEDERRMYRIQ